MMTSAPIVVITFVVLLVIAIFFRNAMRRVFIRTAEILVLVISIVVIAFCGLIGVALTTYGPQVGIAANSELGFLMGAFIGFLISVVLSAVFFVLVEIADNTRKTAALWERSSDRVDWR
jgi:hypothetical protein